MKEFILAEPNSLSDVFLPGSGAPGVCKARAMAQVVAHLTGDVVVTLSPQGRVLDVLHGAAGEAAPPEADAGPNDGVRTWVGQHWVDTVAPECRRKAQRLLEELNASGCASRREINHPAPDGRPVLRAWTAVRLSEPGEPVDGAERNATERPGEPAVALALGHDLAPLRAQLARLHAAQCQLEQSYWDRRPPWGLEEGQE